MAVPKVAAIHDLSGLGKCSLTAAIPILSVCGVQAVPLATAVLSNQTSFEHYVGVDLSEHLPMIADQWQRMDLRLDGIFTGYLSGVQQVEWVSGFLDRFRRENTLVLVDPVLGENGEYYRGFDEEMRCAMRGLCRQADIITPNLTEALMLLGKDARQQNLSPETAKEYARELAELGPKTVIITGIGQGETVWNVGDANFWLETGESEEDIPEPEIFYPRWSAGAWSAVRAPTPHWNGRHGCWRPRLQRLWRTAPTQTRGLPLSIT